MGFGLGDLGAWALAPVTGGGSLILKNAWDKRRPGDPGDPAPRDPLTAGDVTLGDPLKKPLHGIQSGAQTSLADSLGASLGNATASQVASGRVRGDYTGKELGRASAAAGRGVDDALMKVLGETSLKYKQNELGYQDNLALASRIGALNKPSTLEEILAGLGGGADTALKAKGLWDALNAGKSYGKPSVTTSAYDSNGEYYG